MVQFQRRLKLQGCARPAGPASAIGRSLKPLMPPPDYCWSFWLSPDGGSLRDAVAAERHGAEIAVAPPPTTLSKLLLPDGASANCNPVRYLVLFKIDPLDFDVRGRAALGTPTRKRSFRHAQHLREVCRADVRPTGNPKFGFCNPGGVCSDQGATMRCVGGDRTSCGNFARARGRCRKRGWRKNGRLEL
jgi:hypothetical protein